MRTNIKLKISKDPKLSGARIKVHAGKKWRAATELKIAEERLREKEILGLAAAGRAGLEFFPTIRIDKAAGKEKHQLLQGEICKGVEENRIEK